MSDYELSCADGKVVSVDNMKVYRGCRGVVPLNLNGFLCQQDPLLHPSFYIGVNSPGFFMAFLHTHIEQ
jgi:hypothetical protein